MKKLLVIKAILIAAIGLIAPLQCRSQELRVDGMRVLTNDLSASVYQRLDNNGHACALVKVVFPKAGAEFEGNVIGATEYRAGEYWVYLTPGSKFLKMKHAEHSPLMIQLGAPIGPVESKRTYEIKIIAVQPSDDSGSATSQSQTGRLIYSSGNKIFTCDGVYRPDYEKRKANKDKLFETDLTGINRRHFSISFDYYPAEDMLFKRTSTQRSQNSVLTLSNGWRILCIWLNENGKVHISINNRRKGVDTPITYEIDEWNSIAIEYNNGELKVNGQIFRNMDINPYDGDNWLTNTDYGSGESFKGRLTNIKVYSYD